MVEWDEQGMPRRDWVPREEVIDGHVEREALESGEHYGEDWATQFMVHDLAMGICAALRNKGIWTMSDMSKNRALVWAVLARAARSVALEIMKGSQDD